MRHIATVGVLFFTSIAISATSIAQTVDASAELSDAILNLKAKHINSGKVDWDTLRCRNSSLSMRRKPAISPFRLQVGL